MILDFVSLFLWPATAEDIEAERQRLQMVYRETIEIDKVEHRMHQHRQCIRVSWRTKDG